MGKKLKKRHPIIEGATFGDLYNKTIERNKLIKRAGYKLITTWEYDWNALRKNTTRISKNASSIL